MEILRIIEHLQFYPENVVAYKLDGCFAHAVTEAAELLVKQGERIADLEESEHWIPVAERLPEKEGFYLVCTCNGCVTDMHFSPVNRAFNAFDDMLPNNAIECTHWMPLPELPK